LVQSFLKPGKIYAFVRANVGALAATNAGFQEILFGFGSRGSQITSQPGGSRQTIGKQK